jgi:metal-responsive CopG/Arc/MetJ family transcriptional regulator
MNIPKRVYTHGEKKQRGIRLPDELMDELGKIAQELGWNVSDVIQTVLDGYVQDYKKEKSTPESSP